MKCKCHPESPFRWAQNPRPSMFVKDLAFRAKGVVVTEFGSHFTPEEEEKKSKERKEKELIAYKSFGIYLRANPNIKPQLNKHEFGQGAKIVSKPKTTRSSKS